MPLLLLSSLPLAVAVGNSSGRSSTPPAIAGRGSEGRRTCISVWRSLPGAKRPLDTRKRILDLFGGDLAANCSPYCLCEAQQQANFPTLQSSFIGWQISMPVRPPAHRFARCHAVAQVNTCGCRTVSLQAHSAVPFVLSENRRSMTVELGHAITFRFRTGPCAPLEHGPGSRGFKDLPWVALTIPKYHLVTRFSLKWYHKHAGSGSDPWSIPIWHRRRWESGASTTNKRLLPRPGSRRTPVGQRDIGFLLMPRRGRQGEARNLVADYCYRRRPASKSMGNTHVCNAQVSCRRLEAAVDDGAQRIYRPLNVLPKARVNRPGNARLYRREC